MFTDDLERLVALFGLVLSPVAIWAGWRLLGLVG
jgi:hypothetical protein